MPEPAPDSMQQTRDAARWEALKAFEAYRPICGQMTLEDFERIIFDALQNFQMRHGLAFSLIPDEDRRSMWAPEDG